MVLFTQNIKTKMPLTRTVTLTVRVNEPLHRCNLPAFVFAIFRLQDLENQEYPVSAAARMKTRKKRMRLHQRGKTPRKGLKRNPGNQRQNHSGRAIRRARRRGQERWMQPQAERKKMTRLMNRWWKAQRKRETLYPRREVVQMIQYPRGREPEDQWPRMETWMILLPLERGEVKVAPRPMNQPIKVEAGEVARGKNNPRTWLKIFLRIFRFVTCT